MVSLTDLIGRRRLDAVDFSNEKIKETYGDQFEDCSVCRFRLDGVVYVAVEDPCDGYRSSMRELLIQQSAELNNAFPSIDVVGVCINEVMQFFDLETGKAVLEIGTENSDDYYPSFVASFHPENMATNADAVLELSAPAITPAPYDHAAAINLFAADCHAASRKAGWYTDPQTGKALDRNIPEMLCLIHSEISEAMEGYRKGLMDDKLPNRPSMEVELADAMVRIGDVAILLGYDLGGAIVEKMAFNATREDHKLEARKAAGGKAF